ncbi:hypothetical protein [Elioraea rosea]|uniref:hypothetical protein n=1 Tax=Elioraea rosea TaxID=2492390 RepID=UPI0011846272|nr:hypothetical protein [Elioraea rosea]
MICRVILAAVVLLAGCQQVGRVLDPDVAQLERYDAARKEGRLRDIANEPVAASCTAEKQACGRLHAIRAEACLSLALADRAAGAACPAASPSRRADLDCAASEYAAAMASTASGFTPADQGAHRLGRAQALYCRAELDTVASGVPFARESAQVAAGLPPPKREAIGGSAALFLARPGAGADAVRCERAREAGRLATAGLAANPDAEDRALLSRLASDAATRRASIPGCGP